MDRDRVASPDALGSRLEPLWLLGMVALRLPVMLGMILATRYLRIGAVLTKKG